MKQIKYVVLMAFLFMTTVMMAQSTDKEQVTVALSSPR